MHPFYFVLSGLYFYTSPLLGPFLKKEKTIVTNFQRILLCYRIQEFLVIKK